LNASAAFHSGMISVNPFCDVRVGMIFCSVFSMPLYFNVNLMLSNSLVGVGTMSHTLRVQASDDVYQKTMEKMMSQADEEVKRLRWVRCNTIVILLSRPVLILLQLLTNNWCLWLTIF